MLLCSLKKLYFHSKALVSFKNFTMFIKKTLFSFNSFSVRICRRGKAARYCMIYTKKIGEWCSRCPADSKLFEQ